MKQNYTKPRIYVASLSDYNAGRLHGRWIDANQSAKDLYRNIKGILAESMDQLAEGWAIHDYEGFGTLQLPEYASMEDIAALAKGIEEHGLVFVELTKHFGGLTGLEEARNYMEDAYCGEYDDVGWYAATFANDLYHEQLLSLPDVIRNHINWDSAGEHLRTDRTIFTIECNGVVHVFDSQL